MSPRLVSKRQAISLGSSSLPARSHADFAAGRLATADEVDSGLGKAAGLRHLNEQGDVVQVEHVRLRRPAGESPGAASVQARRLELLMTNLLRGLSQRSS